MTDLQLGLLLIGALVVAGVLVYNRMQERSARRETEQAFGSSGRPDVLLGEPRGLDAVQQEPVLSRSAAPAPAGTLPDERIDYVITLIPARPLGALPVLEAWIPIERRFARRAMLVAREGDAWRRLEPGNTRGDTRPCEALRAALQLLTRSGVTHDAELVEFRSQVETMAATFGAEISAPEMRQALEAARELDRTCADADIQVALHVVGGAVTDASLAQYAGQPFQVARQGDGVTFTLDVPRVADIGRSYEAMARAASHLAASLGGGVVDDNGNTVDERSLAAIGAQLESVGKSLASCGIEPGSPLALRLFS